MESGGVGGAVQCLTWDGELVWEYVLSNSDYQHHHDVEPLPNGNVLMIDGKENMQLKLMKWVEKQLTIL